MAHGVKLWTAVTGTQHQLTILLCNGGPGCSDYLEPVAGMLDDAARVIRFEQRGCGRSTEDDQYDVDTALADLEVIRNYYQAASWIVAGHSWGANLALAYALMHPDKCISLIYLSGNGVQNDRDWYENYHLNKSKHGENMPEGAMRANLKVNRIMNASWRKFIQRPSLWADISRLTVPTLLVYGSEDVRPSWPVEQLAHALPKSKFSVIQGAAHYTWLTHFEETKQVLRDFVFGTASQ